MTPYIASRSHLESLLGTAIVAKSLQSLDIADIQPVIDAQNALADGYVSAQVALPPTPAAVAMVAPIVAELVLTALLANSKDETVLTRREAAFKTLREIAAGTFKLPIPVVVDNPETPENEAESGGAAFGAQPRQTRWKTYTPSCDW